MKDTQISLPELGLVAGTRAALGAGLGLLLADRLAPEQRRAIGWTLMIVGLVSTIPLALELFGTGRQIEAGVEPSRGDSMQETASQLGDEVVVLAEF